MGVPDTQWDYVLVGGGLSATVLASSLVRLDASLKILIIEAGPSANDASDIVYASSTNLVGGSYDWKDKTVPQARLSGRSVDMPAGRALGGGTVINMCGWIRGDRTDYDLWGGAVRDPRWSYAGMLPYMKQTETLHSDAINTEQRGTAGPVHIQTVSGTNRTFPLRASVLKSWEEVGVPALPNLDGNTGSSLGVAELQENRQDGRREIASVVYPLDGVTVLTDTLVAKILINKEGGGLHATGVQLADRTQIQAREVIITAGATRTPQILMLSGIGPASELRKHGIDVALDSPDVGKNLCDHTLLATAWKLKDPSAGHALGSSNPLFQQEQFRWGQPIDFVVTTGVRDKAGLAKAIEADEGMAPDPATHPLLKQERAFNEHLMIYAGAPDGSAIGLLHVNLLPTARGTVTLASADINEAPRIDPNFLGTAVDRFVARDGVRQQIRLAGSSDTVLGREILSGEMGAPGFDDGVLTPESTDGFIDGRIAAGTGSCYHAMGTAAMGKVVDSNLRVEGVDRLRVVDASVFPVPITGHLQVAVYALALQAADIIHQDRQNKT
ncbi:hypothetical protein JDV02_010656 [Purpureocillium takamizusanense]|uniref:Glucose-methanol-choline oxidoreductase N-terminal domain-containing protein n=1 Tax=Purpureocillium takamizusanense TaxID=2060973 RepID=A0A9Q8QTD5_9HYPO|nr:uncharacterized protein JDV02_010656 [Purpureocillium takamizusanense]UNI24941.1 hypothetical protein JDV02_010656 [Purpureocillium takamizusanense]